MKILLDRFIIGKTLTIGSLSADGEWICWTGEDQVRPDGTKVYGETAIPTGTYGVIVNESPRLKGRYPRLLDVPNFTGILIHKGNTAEDTKGCILVGEHVDSPDRISHCQKVFDKLVAMIDLANFSGEGTTITITNRWDSEPFGNIESYEWRV